MDMVSFKIYASSAGFLKTLRVDLEAKDVQGAFDDNYSSVTFSSAALMGASSTWITMSVAFSSFPLQSHWIDFSSETVPFSRNLTRFGIRFVATATADLTLYIDDIRFIGATKTPLNPYRLTKQYTAGSLADKDWKQVIVAREKPRNSSFKIDVYTGLGNLSNTKPISASVNKEIYVCGIVSTGDVTIVSSLDFSLKSSTADGPGGVFRFVSGDADDRYIYGYDDANARIINIDKSSMTTAFISTYGVFGAGTTNFNYVQEMSVDTDENGLLWMVDHMNHAVKVFSKSDLSFRSAYGQLGTQTTSFYNPTGIHADFRNVYVGDDTNQAIKRFDRDFNYVDQVDLDINTIGNITLKGDEKYLYASYTRGSDDTVFYIDVVLERRNKSDLKLVNRAIVKPNGVVINSTYTLTGSIAVASGFIYVPFTDNNGNYYLQKRLITDFSLADEYVSKMPFTSVMGDGMAREPALSSDKVNLNVSQDRYVQLKFYSQDELATSFKLIQMSIIAEPRP